MTSTLRNDGLTSTCPAADWNVGSLYILSEDSAHFANRHLIFNFPLCKLYTNSLMSSLNSRRGWKFGSSDRESTGHSAGETGVISSGAFLHTPPLSPVGPTGSPNSTFSMRHVHHSLSDSSVPKLKISSPIGGRVSRPLVRALLKIG